MKSKYFRVLFLNILFITIVFSINIYPSVFSKYKIKKINLKFINKTINNNNNYREILNIKKGDYFNLNKIRKSLTNLNKTGQFQNIEIKMINLNNDKLELIYKLYFKFKIRTIKIVQKDKAHKVSIIKSVFSLRENTFFDKDKLPKAIIEIKNILKYNGYGQSKITYKIAKNTKKGTINILFYINKGPTTKINRINVKIKDSKLRKKILTFFNCSNYIPKKFQLSINKVKKFLVSEKYFFPDIEIKETFIDSKHSIINITITINPGYKYLFRFIGMKPKMSLISIAWKKKVFEKWSESESVTRLLNYLYTKGYLQATINSKIIKSKNKIKTIIFNVNRGKKYYLNKLYITGNTAISSQRIRQVINADKLLYNKLFGFNTESLLVDIQVLKLLYLNEGYKFVKINVKKYFKGNKVDIELAINEGKKNIVDSIEFTGNKAFSSKYLSKHCNAKPNGPFIKSFFKRDIEAIKKLYLNKGYKDIVINYEISNGYAKSILISINEGYSYFVSKLIIIGASKTQYNLLKNRFPIKVGDIYNSIEIQKFRSEMDNSGIFSSFDISKIKRNANSLDIIIKVIPEKSKYYGFGLGWEDRRSIRGTVEYQVQNIFNSYSNFSTTLQLGLKEIRGAVNYDTPYLFNTEINSSTRLWMEDEIFPSYKSTRYGISESIIKKINNTSYISAAYMLYKTNITEKFGNPDLIEDFSTSALSFLYIIEKRDNPFNPTRGSFFSSNLKLALPLFGNTVFYKFLWNYQKNWRFLKTGTFSLSIRNGFASGDVHISERFFAGGSHTFRGTPDDRLGPINTDYNQPRGGNAMILFNIEATFPLNVFPIDNLYYSVFLDVGNIYWETKDFNMQKVEKAIGFGLKYRTPMGPLKIEFAWNLRGKNADKFFNFSIGIGNVF